MATDALSASIAVARPTSEPRSQLCRIGVVVEHPQPRSQRPHHQLADGYVLRHGLTEWSAHLVAPIEIVLAPYRLDHGRPEADGRGVLVELLLLE